MSPPLEWRAHLIWRARAHPVPPPGHLASPATVSVNEDVAPAEPNSTNKELPRVLRKRKSKSLPGGFKLAQEPFIHVRAAGQSTRQLVRLIGALVPSLVQEGAFDSDTRSDESSALAD